MMVAAVVAAAVVAAAAMVAAARTVITELTPMLPAHSLAGVRIACPARVVPTSADVSTVAVRPAVLAVTVRLGCSCAGLLRLRGSRQRNRGRSRGRSRLQINNRFRFRFRYRRGGGRRDGLRAVAYSHLRAPHPR
ncbi:hypothetical protein, partial [Arthrobacter sp. 3Tela_A]|uniref:hypothetical protein n=1 Tax=Arthrobacter sp. 3Tela_A TaxID=3093743 RepID=UPI003BB68DB5